MNIEKDKTNGCDKLSRVYEDMFNALQEVMKDEDKLKNLSPLDYSALGIYIGKFVEQEINSSVVQIMRAFRGIDMPTYYCKRDPNFYYDIVVVSSRKVRLNEQKQDNKDQYSLKAIPLGDAYYALQQLKEEDEDGFFNQYPWLSDTIFIEAWRRLFRFRNRMAHIGEIIYYDTLKDGYEQFLRFLRYMPDMLEAKKKLAPDGYVDSLSTPKEGDKVTRYTKYDNLEDAGMAASDLGTLPNPKEGYKVTLPYIITDNPPSDKPFAPKEIAIRYCELNHTREWTEEYYDIAGEYNLDAIIFEGSNGKRGLKDCCEKILVPAKYDGFGFIPKPFVTNRESINAVRDGKYVLVKLDGSGEELTKEPYDEIRLATYYHLGSPYVYRKNGMQAWGFMNMSGVEVCDNIIDDYYCGLNSMWYDSGDKMGYWQFGVIFLPPIYDNIEQPGEPKEPLLFTLDGVQGYVRHDGSFLPLSEFKRMEEEDDSQIVWDFICEQYEI